MLGIRLCRKLNSAEGFKGFEHQHGHCNKPACSWDGLGGTVGGSGAPGAGGHSGDCSCDDPLLPEGCDRLTCLHEEQSTSGLCGDDWQNLTCDHLSEGQNCGSTEAICLEYSDRFSTCSACANVNSNGSGGD